MTYGSLQLSLMAICRGTYPLHHSPALVHCSLISPIPSRVLSHSSTDQLAATGASLSLNESTVANTPNPNAATDKQNAIIASFISHLLAAIVAPFTKDAANG